MSDIFQYLNSLQRFVFSFLKFLSWKLQWDCLYLKILPLYPYPCRKLYFMNRHQHPSSSSISIVGTVYICKTAQRQIAMHEREVSFEKGWDKDWGTQKLSQWNAKHFLSHMNKIVVFLIESWKSLKNKLKFLTYR